MSLTNQANRKRLNGCSVKTILEDTIMKMFKKLMAVALAGVMAMAVLTGCGSSLNEKEVIAVINDAISLLWQKSWKMRPVKRTWRSLSRLLILS